ncbi:uncharacterized protein LACBIDRAFT_299618 [Laccaria bicolor S238N-H82]|uniref:Predicted protein n=1 Tax=Laccaria bicolor (strain S238N-H82 / ATCC MYA-4686) TaxID=486041 RepID=B0DEZ8_LACBS|nr:uncharacterized protein LACBIDRAFT_299618 [Laccaria bicolor S238N-H82]EDR06760.1 predicted protein [Laccaria bicolor S238N-H82]|eukprot:XP_001882607.1 predicted protein [Laccaria bicolor S238N-H82]
MSDSTYQPSSSPTRPCLVDRTHGLNSPSLSTSSKAASNKAAQKAILHHLELVDSIDIRSPPRKHRGRKSARKAALKTVEDFAPLGILDSQIDSQTWHDNLVAEGASREVECASCEEVLSNCDQLYEELTQTRKDLICVQEAHLKTTNENIRLAKDYDRLEKEMQSLREAMAYVGGKLLKSAKKSQD